MEQTTQITEAKRGGKRENSGRKPSGVAKSPLTIYIENSIIEKTGKIELRNKIYSFVNSLKNDA